MDPAGPPAFAEAAQARSVPGPTRKWSRRRIGLTVGPVLGVVVVVLLVASTWLTGWGVFFHWSCASGKTVDSQVEWVPFILLNAPFGGNVSGLASIPSGFIGNWPPITAEGAGIRNGSFGGLFHRLIVNVSEDANETVWGPGASVRCGQSFAVSLVFDYDTYSGMMGNWGNWSDSNEPHTFVLATGNGESSAYFDNGFTIANAKSVSTCNSSQESLPVRSTGFNIWLSFAIEGKPTSVPYLLPFPLVYHYYFPANFGTWQVDNLSAPGGPGGGWAFSYAPCP